MKDKDRITCMVCTSSHGKKCPLAHVGKSKKPRCFDDHGVPDHYTSNKTAWFNKHVMRWWFCTVFDPFFRREFRHGQNSEAHCIVILDGCSAHEGIQEWLDTNGLAYIHVIKLPPNVTSRLQPMDQGVISWSKKKYKYGLVTDLVTILTNEEMFSDAVESRRGGGRDGVDQACRPHVHDAITRINKIWDDTIEASIMKCWTVADCMPREDEVAGDVNDDGSNAVDGSDGVDDHTGSNDGSDGVDDHTGSNSNDSSVESIDRNHENQSITNDAMDEEFDTDLEMQLEELHLFLKNTDDVLLQQEFAEFVIGSNTVNISMQDVVEAWNKSEHNEMRVSVDGAMDECYNDAAEQTYIEAEIEYAEAEVLLEQQQLEQEEDDDECKDSDSSDGNSVHSNDENTENHNSDDDDMISVASVETVYKNATQTEAIELLQDKAAEFDELLQYFCMTEKFSGLPSKVSNKIDRMRHLSIASRETLDAAELEIKHALARGGRQHKMNEFFTPKKKK